MDEIRSLISLRALILNDNEIVTLCPLDQMKELNTLVLSRNSISKISGSLNKVKSITKLSLSNCQLQSINSLKSCTELKELRLAHNDIKTLPSELVVNMKLQLLDIGNNSITSWSDLKVLPSLVNLKNLNLQGNPVAEKDKLAKKIRKLAPNLQILNAKPIDKSSKNEKGDRDETVDDYSFTAAKKQGAQKEGKIEQRTTKQNPKHKRMSQTNDDQHDAATDVVIERGLRHKDRKTMGLLEENDTITEKKLNKKLKKVQENEVNVNDNKDIEFTNPFVEKQLKRKKDKASRILEAEAANEIENGTEMEKELKRKSKRAKQTEANVIDDGETPFADLFAITGENSENSAGGLDEKVVQDVSATGGLVTFPVKSKKIKNRAQSSPLQLAPVAEVGLGGQSMWSDE
ncbi:leucine-rich repeat-containing protein ODA7 isoform X2 [Rhododendron vialii]|nr:leucine-rich repeat-containing protein ODA7 isoform X2 [Rhododendron vialii]